MKKIILTGCTAVAMLLTGSINAQNFYAEISGGYGFGPNQNRLGTETYVDVTGDGSYERSIYGTLGSGLNITVTPGYNITDYIGVEVGINYFKGSETTMEETTSSNPELTGYREQTAYSDQFRIIPQLVLNTGGETLYGFSKVGLVIPVSGATYGTIEAGEVGNPGDPVIKNKIETKNNGSVTLGFRGAIGVGYNITDAISISAEAFYTSLHIKAKSREIESYTSNGQNAIANAPTIQTETEYVDELNSSSNNPNYIGDPSDLNLDAPMEELTAPTDFSQVGFQIGIKYNF